MRISADISFERVFQTFETEDIQLDDAWDEDTRSEPSDYEWKELEKIIQELENIDWKQAYLNHLENEYYEGKEDCYD